MPVPACVSLDHAIDRNPPIASPMIQVMQALEMMRQARTSYILVADESKTLCGLISERYLVWAIAHRQIALDVPLGHILPSNVVVARSNECQDLIEARAKLSESRVSHLPLVNEHNQIEGCISYDRLNDLLNPIEVLRLCRVKEAMVSDVLDAAPTCTLTAISELMADHGVSCLVIRQSRDSAPLGIISERDIVRLWSEGGDFKTLQAQDVMSQDIKSVQDSDSLWDAHEQMYAHHIRRLLVMNVEGQMVGLLTQSDILQQLSPQESRATLETLDGVVSRQTDDLDARNKKLQRKIKDRKRAKAALQKQIARERMMTRITQKIRESLDIQTILQTSISEVNAFLEADETFIYLVQDENPQGDRVAEVITESAEFSQCQVIQGAIQSLDINFYTKGRIHSIPDLQAQDLSARQAKCLIDLGYQSTLIAPIHIKQEFWGLLLVNQKQPRQWQRQDINLLEQIVFQIGIALQQAMLYTQLELANQKLRQQVSVDGLTQVANRRHFDQSLQTEWLRMRREQEPLSIIICDVDHFKLYNDHYGHQAGDDCLIKIAQALQKTIKRPADIVARYGGEEFVILLPNTKLAGACQLAESARCNIEALQLEHQSSTTSEIVSLSLGVASCIPQDYSSPEALLKEADDALYDAKDNGRNQWLASGLEEALGKVYS